MGAALANLHDGGGGSGGCGGGAAVRVESTGAHEKR